MRRRTRVLCSIGVGPHAEFLAVARETFDEYARRHGYEVVILDAVPETGRPLSWSKVTLIQELLKRFDLVLWVDADAAVVDPSADIAEVLGKRDLMALVAHKTPEGDDAIPNCGVWLLRDHRMTRRFLGDVWASTRYLDHRWWENAAVLNLLGFELEPKVHLAAPTPMYGRTAFLPLEWNSIPIDASPNPRIVHFAGQPLDDRLAGLRAAVGEFRRNIEPASP